MADKQVVVTESGYIVECGISANLAATFLTIPGYECAADISFHIVRT